MPYYRYSGKGLLDTKMKMDRAVYAIDQFVGNLRQLLVEIRAGQDTIIIVCPDNGLFLGEHGLGGKTILYEESVHVPLIIYSPFLPQQDRGAQLDQLVVGQDIPATILDMCGLAIPVTYQGMSLMPLMEGKTVDWRRMSSRKPLHRPRLSARRSSARQRIQIHPVFQQGQRPEEVSAGGHCRGTTDLRRTLQHQERSEGTTQSGRQSRIRRDSERLPDQMPDIGDRTGKIGARKADIMKHTLILLTALLLAPVIAPASPETAAQHDARMAWWHEAKFGMFIHWGLYAIPARGEWVMNREKIPVAEYEKLAKQFNPVKFNADEWVRIAKDAGMKYIVITSKHHDGFAMFGSKVSPYNIVDATPFKRDPMKELAAACAKEGVKLGFYYSKPRTGTTRAARWHAARGIRHRKATLTNIFAHWPFRRSGNC